MKSLFIIGTLLAIASCDKSTPLPSKPNTSTPGTIKPPVDKFFSVYYDLTSLPFTTDFESAKTLGSVQDLALNEISGTGPGSIGGTLWCEEDSGNENNIYLIKTTGEFLGTVRLTTVSDRDWEDMAVTSGPVASLRYIYVAEIGDNNKSNDVKYIFRFPEPSIATSDFPFTSSVNSLDKISFHYPDGIKNAEALMVDPLTNDIYIVSKETQAVIYVARYPQNLSDVFYVTKLGVLPISDVTAADISPDGKEVVIKNYSTILYWKKSGNETISELLASTPLRAPYQIEEKGESISWAADGSGYFTTSELSGQPIYFYRRK